MRSSKKKTTRFIAMWDMFGLECLINVTQIEKQHEQWEKENVFHIIKNEPTTPKPNHVPLQQMILRARYNGQRHYEIYAFDSTLTEKDIKEIFENTPQVIVDTIRKTGHEYYSDRVLERIQVIV